MQNKMSHQLDLQQQQQPTQATVRPVPPPQPPPSIQLRPQNAAYGHSPTTFTEQTTPPCQIHHQPRHQNMNNVLKPGESFFNIDPPEFRQKTNHNTTITEKNSARFSTTTTITILEHQN